MDTNGQSEWHSIRPWSPRLALLVREITSVSATFILSSSLSEPLNGNSSEQNHGPDMSPASMDLAIDGTEHDPADDHESPDTEEVSGTTQPRELIISNALARGLSVNVNGSPWQRVLIRIDDKVDEAVIIIYGLMPGRQYDIDMGLVQGVPGGTNLRRQVTTEDRANNGGKADHERPSSNEASPEASTSSQPLTTAAHIALPTPPQSPSPTAHPSSHMSVEERAAQLRQTLSIVHDERAALTTSLKTARREAQKADAALRSQIDTLRRASEKNTAAENRAKQKVLALQEAVKRAQSATAEMEELVKEVENALPAVQAERREKERVYNSVFAEAERTRKEIDREAEIAKKKAERGDAELSALNNRLERISGKREKLEGEGGTIQELEEELRQIQMEIERADMDPYGSSAGETSQSAGIDGYPFTGTRAFQPHDGVDDSTEIPGDEGDGWDPRISYLPSPARMNSQPPAPPPPGLILGPIGRPPPAPIQKPTNSYMLVPSSSSTAAPNTTNNFGSSSGKRSHRKSMDLPFIFQPPTQPASGPSQSLSSSVLYSPQQQRSQPASPPSGSFASSGSGTTLSSKAPPFEPSRGVVQAVRAAVGTSPTQTPRANNNGGSGTTGGRRRSNSKWGKGGGSGDGHSGAKQ